MAIIEVQNDAEFTAAMSAASSGDTIRMFPGNYAAPPEETSKNSGTVHVTAETPGTVILGGLDMNAAHGWSFSGIEFTNKVRTFNFCERMEWADCVMRLGLNIKAGCDGLKVSGCDISGGEVTQALIFNGALNFELSECDIHHFKPDGARVISSRFGLIENNIIRDPVSVPGDHPDGFQSGHFWDGTPCTDIIIRGNQIRGDSEKAQVAIQGLFMSSPGTGYRNFDIHDNLIEINSPNSLAMDGAMSNVDVHHNTLILLRNGGGKIRPGVNAGLGCPGMTVRRNACMQIDIGEIDISETGESFGFQQFDNFIMSSDPADTNYWLNCVEGPSAPGEWWRRFMPKSGGPIDGQDFGAHARLAELQNGDMSMTLVYSLETAAAKGATVVNPDGTWTYTPNLNEIGADSWQYRVTDDVFQTFGVGTMTGNIVAPVPPSPDGSFQTDANQPVSGDLKTLVNP